VRAILYRTHWRRKGRGYETSGTLLYLHGYPPRGGWPGEKEKEERPREALFLYSPRRQKKREMISITTTWRFGNRAFYEKKEQCRSILFLAMSEGKEGRALPSFPTRRKEAGTKVKRGEEEKEATWYSFFRHREKRGREKKPFRLLPSPSCPGQPIRKEKKKFVQRVPHPLNRTRRRGGRRERERVGVRFRF